MDEIYEKMSELIKSAEEEHSEDLNKKVLEIENELNQIENQLQFIQSSLTRPVLESNRNELQNQLNELKDRKQKEDKQNIEKFENSKKELLDLIDQKLEKFKSKTEINSNLENVKQEKEKWNKLLAQNIEKRNAIMDKIKNTGFVDNNLDSFTQKIGMAEGKLKELSNKEEEFKKYVPIEENIEEIQEIEHLKMRAKGFNKNEIEKITNDPFYEKMFLEKLEKEMLDENKTDIESTLKDENEVKVTSEDEVEVIPENEIEVIPEDEIEVISKNEMNDALGNTQEENVVEPKGKNWEKLDIEEVREPNQSVSLKRIIIGKGVTIENNHGQQEKFKFKMVRKNLKNKDLYQMMETIGKMMPEYSNESINKEVLEKVDPNVIFALQRATDNYGVSKEQIGGVMSSYIKALNGEKQEGEKIKNFITYDRTKMDIWRTSSFLGKIINRKYFNELKKYQESAKEFVNIIEDTPRKKVTEWLIGSKPAKMLNAGKTIAGDKVKEKKQQVEELYENKKTQAQEYRDKIKRNTEIDRRRASNETSRWEPNLEKNTKSNRDDR